MKKAKKAPKKISAEIREETTEIAQGGKKLLKNIDKRMDQVEEKSKRTLKELRNRLKKAYEALTEDLSDTPYMEYIDPLDSE